MFDFSEVCKDAWLGPYIMVAIPLYNLFSRSIIHNAVYNHSVADFKLTAVI